MTDPVPFGFTLLAQDGQLSAPEHRTLKARIDELFEINAEGLN